MESRVSCGVDALFAWVRVAIRPMTDPAWDYWLLARRSLSDPRELAYYVCFAPANTPLAELVRVAGTRWAIEDGFAAAKGEVGLDHCGVRRWAGWQRHVTLCLWAHAFLVVTQARANAVADPPVPAQSGHLPGAGWRAREHGGGQAAAVGHRLALVAATPLRPGLVALASHPPGLRQALSLPSPRSHLS